MSDSAAPFIFDGHDADGIGFSQCSGRQAWRLPSPVRPEFSDNLWWLSRSDMAERQQKCDWEKNGNCFHDMTLHHR